MSEWLGQAECNLVLYQTPYSKGEGESGTVAYTAICSPWNFKGMNESDWLSTT